MYGTVARLTLLPGKEAAMRALADDYAAETVPGYLGEYVFRMDAEPDVYYMMALFESRDAYHANAQSPAQHERYLKFRALLAAEPEWHDGEVISQPR